MQNTKRELSWLQKSVLYTRPKLDAKKVGPVREQTYKIGIKIYRAEKERIKFAKDVLQKAQDFLIGLSDENFDSADFGPYLQELKQVFENRKLAEYGNNGARNLLLRNLENIETYEQSLEAFKTHLIEYYSSGVINSIHITDYLEAPKHLSLDYSTYVETYYEKWDAQVAVEWACHFKCVNSHNQVF